jgi:integrase
MQTHRRRTPGIRIRHRKACRSRSGATCNCTPSHEAIVYSKRAHKKLRKTFPTLAAAKTWRQDAVVAARKGTLEVESTVTVREAASAWLTGAQAGVVRTRSGEPYKPSAIRSYEAALRLYVLPDFSGARLSEVRRRDVQDLAERLLAQGLDPSTVRNALMPLRAIYRRAMARGEVGTNPTNGLELPAPRGKRERVANPAEAAALIAALDEPDRAIWATAMYAGLRRGELLALRWEDIDLDARTLAVLRAYDITARQFIEPKSAAGLRVVPLAEILRGQLLSHRVLTGARTGLVFARTDGSPISYWTLIDRARRRWKAAGLAPIGLHECRHNCASLMIAAGVNAKTLSVYMGHAGVAITLDRYGHLMPGNEAESARRLDIFLGTVPVATVVTRPDTAFVGGPPIVEVIGHEPSSGRAAPSLTQRRPGDAPRDARPAG